MQKDQAVNKPQAFMDIDNIISEEAKQAETELRQNDSKPLNVML